MNRKILLMLSIVATVVILSGCDDDGPRKHKAEATTSFDGKWEFDDATFGVSNNGLLSIWFFHQTEDPDISIEISFRNIEPKEGTYTLVYYSGGGPAPGKPTSYFRVLVGEDTLAESYFIDTSAVAESTLTITDVRNNKIKGEFQAAYIKDDYPYNKAAPWIPDAFYITEGLFNASEN